METLEQKEIGQIDVRTELPIGSGGTSQIVGADSLHDTLGEIADSFDVTGFKCAKCGLVHSHDTTKHRLSDTFDASGDDFSDMEYNSTCHCGLQEAARRGSDVGIDGHEARKLASNAPIPSDTVATMDEQFGSI